MKSVRCIFGFHSWKSDLGRTDYRRCRRCPKVQKLRNYQWIDVIGMQVVKQ